MAWPIPVMFPGADGAGEEEGKTKKKRKRNKKKGGGNQQTDPPSIPVKDLFPNGPKEGEILEYPTAQDE